jgi:intracellular sulfur oxidation DsrE/DsrF family protein
VTQSVCHAGLHSDVSSVLLVVGGSLLSKTQKGESNKMKELLTEAVKSNVCLRDLHSECAYGEADAATCVKCTADAFGEIVRIQL